MKLVFLLQDGPAGRDKAGQFKLPGTAHRSGAVATVANLGAFRKVGFWPKADMVRVPIDANPGDLPIQHRSRYYLTVNNSAAKSIELPFRERCSRKQTGLCPNNSAEPRPYEFASACRSTGEYDWTLNAPDCIGC